MNVESLKYVYFVGIGGIGMSAIARYFVLMGKAVLGYDRTRTQLTGELEGEGIKINYIDDVRNIPEEIKTISDREEVLVVYTPAIPQGHTELNYFRNNGFTVLKRAEVLGLISRNSRCIGIAGTHGKTSVTTMTAHLLKQSEIDCSAFLGGVSKDYNTNFLFSEQSDIVVVEADEFDRSFHQLTPEAAVITAMDADHLDIYGSHDAILESFYNYLKKIKPHGHLVYKLGLPVDVVEEELKEKSVDVYSYSLRDTSADFYTVNLQIVDAEFVFDMVTPGGVIENIHFSVPGTINIDNAVAAVAMAVIYGASYDEIRKALACFSGVRRRFDYHVRNSNTIYIDDYAHHPAELKACISSIKDMFPGKKVTGVFQPHLYSRTKDFAGEFAQSLSLLDELFLMDIYPAREEPIPGVTSEIIFDNVEIDRKTLCNKENIMDLLEQEEYEVLLTMGAGDIDTFIKPITDMLISRL